MSSPVAAPADTRLLDHLSTHLSLQTANRRRARRSANLQSPIWNLKWKSWSLAPEARRFIIMNRVTWH